MGKLYFFNPENDLALAADSPHFTPPRAAIALQRAGASLAGYVCVDGDSFIGSELDYRWFDEVGKRLHLPHVESNWSPANIFDCRPWGWSLYTVRQFLNHGIDVQILPSSSSLEVYRNLSHRRLTIDILKSLCDQLLPYPLHELPMEVQDTSAIERKLSEGRHIYVKSPWSGSGRGIIDSMSAPPAQVLRLATGVIKHQGSVMVEEGLDKVADFAMLFTMTAGKARFEGYSLFFNSGYSAYSGNILADDEVILKILGQHVDRDWITATRGYMSKALEDIVGKSYNGPLGIDMLLYRKGNACLIAPCIECNLRMTMGRVAHIINNRYMAEGVSGQLKIEHINETSSQHLIEATSMAEIGDGRLRRGTVALTPPEGNAFCWVMSTISKS